METILTREMLEKNEPLDLITGYSVPRGITVISKGCFKNIKHLETINIPDTVTEIEPEAFMNCTHLKSIRLPKNLKTIPHRAFDGCVALEHINIPNSVTKIEPEAFAYCTSLRSINLPENLEEISMGTFINCNSLDNIIIPASVKKIDDYAFTTCNTLTDIKIPSHIKCAEKAFLFSDNAAKSLQDSFGIPDSSNTLVLTGQEIKDLKDACGKLSMKNMRTAPEKSIVFDTICGKLDNAKSQPCINDYEHVLAGKNELSTDEYKAAIFACKTTAENTDNEHYQQFMLGLANKITAAKERSENPNSDPTWQIDAIVTHAKTTFTIKHDPDEEIDKSQIHSVLAHTTAHIKKKCGYEFIDARLSDWDIGLDCIDNDSDTIETELDAYASMNIRTSIKAKTQKEAEELAEKKIAEDLKNQYIYTDKPVCCTATPSPQNRLKLSDLKDIRNPHTRSLDDFNDDISDDSPEF